MLSLRELADNSKEGSLANTMRRRRFVFFKRLLDVIERPIRILDVGGTKDFWLKMGFGDEAGVTIVISNISESQMGSSEHTGATRFEFTVADARSLSAFEDKEFDIVFSNSVIEHVGSFDDQRAMMREVLRVGKRYWVQTPNYWFPIEPHFHLPGFQFLPLEARAWLLTRFSLGWTPKQSDMARARRAAEGTRLLSRRELRLLSPNARVYTERFLGLAKSFSIYEGF